MIKRLYNILFTLILVSTCLNAAAQKPDFNTVDSITYQQYLSKDHQNLIETGNEAIYNEIDFFYLRLRMGIAHYELKQYRLAAKEFEKALTFNSYDAVTLEYLYYSYVFSAREDDAAALSSRFSAEMKKRLNIKKTGLLSLGAEGGIASSNNEKLNGKADIDGTANIYGESDLNKNITYLSLNSTGRINHRLLLTGAYNNVLIDKTKDIRFTNTVITPTNTNPPMPPKVTKTPVRTVDDYKLIQNEFHLGCNITLNKGWKLFPSAHFIAVDYTTIESEQDKNNKNYRIKEERTTISNYAAALQTTRYITNGAWSLNSLYGHFNNADQLQLGVSRLFYPFKTSNFYSLTTLTAMYESPFPRLIFNQKFGGNFTPKLGYEIYVTKGNLQNYSEANGFVTYNIADNIKLKTGAVLNYSLSKKLDVSLRYDYIKREGYYQFNTNETQTKYNTTNYQYNSIIIGLKWKL